MCMMLARREVERFGDREIIRINRRDIMFLSK